MKINIDLIKKFLNLLNFLFYKFQCRVSNFDEILFTPRLCKIGVFLHPGKSHALNGSSDSTPRKLTLKIILAEFRCTPITNTGAYFVLSK